MNELRAFVAAPLASEASFDQIHFEERDKLNIRPSWRGVNSRLRSWLVKRATTRPAAMCSPAPKNHGNSETVGTAMIGACAGAELSAPFCSSTSAPCLRSLTQLAPRPAGRGDDTTKEALSRAVPVLCGKIKANDLYQQNEWVFDGYDTTRMTICV
jgi:hypothetical protein